jgi:hypothetical protein
MKNRSSLFVPAALAVLVAASAGCDSCKKGKDAGQKVEKEPVAKVKNVDEAPAPEDTLLEVAIKDPEGVTKRTADGAGFDKEIGPSPWETVIASIDGDAAKKGLRAIDPHGAMAAVVLLHIDAVSKPHFVVAAKLKDPEVATVALTSAAKGGDLTAWDSKVLGTQAFEPKKGQGDVAVYGPYVLASDTRDALEAAGKYVAWKASKGDAQPHDLSARVPLDKIGPKAAALVTALWASLPSGTVPPKLHAALEPMLEPLLQGVSDMGELAIDVDSDGKLVKVDDHVGAKGTFAAWLGKYPAGDATTLLTMPKADGVSLTRFPDDLAPVIYAGVDDALSSSSLSPADRADLLKQLQTLGKSLGHEVDMSNKGSGPTSEFLLRFDITDPKGAKTAMAALEKAALKALGGAKAPAKTTAYKKFGADGDEIELTAGTGLTFHLLWAVRGSYLFVGFSNGAFSLADAGIDPASTATVSSDAAAKTKLASFPTKGLIGASYGDTWSFSKGLVGGGGGAPAASGSGVSWGYTVVDASGVSAKGEVPLAFIGDMARFYMGMMAMFASPPPPY